MHDRRVATLRSQAERRMIIPSWDRLHFRHHALANSMLAEAIFRRFAAMAADFGAGGAREAGVPDHRE